MTPADSRSRLVLSRRSGSETDAATGGPGTGLLAGSPVACIHATRPVVTVHHIPAQSVHLHLTRRERVECERTHDEQMARMFLAGEVA